MMIVMKLPETDPRGLIGKAVKIYIQKTLGELVENRTTIVIAHRLSTIPKLDRIIVMKNG